MVQLPGTFGVSVVWRDKKLMLDLNSEASLKELGEELQQLTGVKADTMKLIIPQISNKSSKLFSPFSDAHAYLKLGDIGIMQGKPLRMMGVSEREVEQLSADARANLRIAGFEEEERRMKQRIYRGPQRSLKLPEGPYIFCGFRTLQLPGIELNPPASEALKRMHMLAADPGIVTIMNKHRWRVGILTEMAPVGYVGISPRCVLGLNKNQGEEISLRLRTDDLKGFRKYESIKKTLLHELAHMIYSEHDSNFYALDKQLNEEAFALDWTRSRSHILSDAQFSGRDDVDILLESENPLSHKLGGETSHMTASASAAATSAAFHRWVDSFNIQHECSASKKLDSDDNTTEGHRDFTELDSVVKEGLNQEMLEPDPDDSEAQKDIDSNSSVNERFDCTNTKKSREEPDPDDIESIVNSMQIENITTGLGTSEEPDPDDVETRTNGGEIMSSDAIGERRDDQLEAEKINMEPDPDDSGEVGIVRPQSNLDETLGYFAPITRLGTEEPDPDDEELRRIQDPATVFCNKLSDSIKKLQNDLQVSNAHAVLDSLIKIIRNITENPGERKYKRIRKANPVFQRSVACHKAAIEILSLAGFHEDIIVDETGKTETYLILKRDDPAMLWLAKNILEMHLNK